jgi:hypothetical protein
MVGALFIFILISEIFLAMLVTALKNGDFQAYTIKI